MRVVFMGTPAFAVPSLRALHEAGGVIGVVSAPDRPAGRGRRLARPPVAEYARAQSLPLIQPASPVEPAALQTLREWAPDIIVVAAYGHILRPALLGLPRLGCLNVHASLLPRHRGASPIAAALLAGDRQTGVTIMLLDEGMDTGPVLAQQTLDIADDDTTGTLSDKLAELGAALLVETLPAWERGEIVPRAQDERLATYCKILRKEDGRLDWSLPARELWLRVRAFQPWPGAFTIWSGQFLKIIAAWPAEDRPAGAEIGQVVSSNGEPAVVAGAGMLILRQVQLAGKRPTDAVSFARGQRGFWGSILG